MKFKERKKQKKKKPKKENDKEERSIQCLAASNCLCIF